MRVKLETTIITHINLSPGVTLEEARREIFIRFNESIEEDDPVEGIKAAHSNAVCLDEIVGTEVTHSFEEMK